MKVVIAVVVIFCVGSLVFIAYDFTYGGIAQKREQIKELRMHIAYVEGSIAAMSHYLCEREWPTSLWMRRAFKTMDDKPVRSCEDVRRIAAVEQP